MRPDNYTPPSVGCERMGNPVVREAIGDEKIEFCVRERGRTSGVYRSGLTQNATVLLEVTYHAY